MDVVVKGTDNNVYLNTANGSSWSGYVGLGAPTSAGIKGAPAVVSWGPGRLDVFVRGADDKLWQRFSTSGGTTWSAWLKPVGDQGVLGSGPDVATWGPNRLDVFVRGTDGGVYQRTWDGASWGRDWLGRGTPPALTSGAPATASWGPGTLDLFVRDSNGKLWQTFLGSSGWTAWFQPAGTQGGTIAAPSAADGGSLDAASWGVGHYSVFVRGTDGQMYETRYQSGWSGWDRPVTDSIQGGPAATSRATGQLDVVTWARDGSAHKYLVR